LDYYVAKKKTLADYKAENRILRRTHISVSIASVINTLIRWAGIVGIVYCIYLSINALAGRQTIANIAVNFLGSLTVSKSVAYILGGGGVIYGVAERKLRQRTIKRLQGRIQQLETARDPKRTSSRLTERGETNPSDL
jgi:hypothetical protein